MNLRYLALVPALLLLAACGGNGENATDASIASEAMSPDELFLNSIRSHGIDQTGDVAVLELAEAICTASDIVDDGEAFATAILEKSPRYLDRGTESTFVKVAVEEYCAGMPAQPTSSTSSVTPQGSGNSIMDTAYLKLLESKNLGYLEDEQAIGIGTLVCEGLDAGRRPVELGAQIARDSNGMFTLKEGATFVGVSIATYCPEHESLLGN